MLGQELDRFGKALIGDALDLGVDVTRGRFAIGPRQPKPVASAIFAEGQGPDLRAHSPSHHHLVGDRRHLLQVVGRAGRD